MSALPLLFNTMPKSGSIYIGNTLARGLQREFSTEPAAHGFFPTYFLMPNRLLSLASSGAFRQEHFDASPINLRMLSRYSDRIVVNMRDPRQATLSWTHHAARLAREHPDGVNYSLDDPPPGLFERSLSEQIDHHLTAQLSYLVRWCREWIDAANDDAGPVRVLFMNYEDFVAEPQQYCRKVCQWWGFDPDEFSFPKLDKSMALHYRKGEPDEWRRVFSEEQIARANDIIGPDLMAQFGWKP